MRKPTKFFPGGKGPKDNLFGGEGGSEVLIKFLDPRLNFSTKREICIGRLPYNNIHINMCMYLCTYIYTCTLLLSMSIMYNKWFRFIMVGIC